MAVCCRNPILQCLNWKYWACVSVRHVSTLNQIAVTVCQTLFYIFLYFKTLGFMTCLQSFCCVHHLSSQSSETLAVIMKQSSGTSGTTIFSVLLHRRHVSTYIQVIFMHSFTDKSIKCYGLICKRRPEDDLYIGRNMSPM